MLTHNYSAHSCSDAPPWRWEGDSAVCHVGQEGGGKASCLFLCRPDDYPSACLSFLSRAISTPGCTWGSGVTEHRSRAETQAGVQKALNYTCISRPTSGVCHYFCGTLLPICLPGRGQGGTEMRPQTLDTRWPSVGLTGQGLPNTILRRLFLTIAHSHSLKCSGGAGSTSPSWEGC